MKWDLRKAFHQVPVEARLRRKLRSRYWSLKEQRMIRIQQRTLPQGFGPSPILLGKVLKPVMARWRSVGIRIALATDDLVMVATDMREAMMHAYVVTTHLGVVLGAVFSADKGQYRPAHRVVWYGLAFCSVTSVTMLPSNKVTKVVQVAVALVLVVSSTW